MPVAKTRTHIAFDEPAPVPPDCKVYDGEGRLLHIIPGDVLAKRKLSHQRAPETPRRGVPLPQVAMRRATRREERL